MGNASAKVAGNYMKTNFVTEYRAQGSCFRYASELINMQKCYNSTTKIGM